MKIEKQSRKIWSSDYKHFLSGVVFVPEGEPKGIFEVVHGMREHISLYEDFMQEIAEEGYIVFGYDQLGHGHTAENTNEFGFIAQNDGWKLLVNDSIIFAREIKKQYGQNLPYILMGFSMGSFIVRINAAHFNKQDKLIVMGTGGYDPRALLGLEFLKRVKRVRGDHYVSRFVETTVFGSFNDRFADCGELGWLTSIEENRKAYENDPLCSFRFTISAMEDLIQLSEECNTNRWYAEIDKTKPILLLSGGDDLLGGYGEGICDIYKKLKENGANVEMKLYEGCRHAILKDTRRDEVIRDIKQFLER